MQGLGLKPLINFLRIQSSEKEAEKLQAIELRIRLAESVLNYLDANYPEETQHHETYKRVRDRFERIVDIAKGKLESNDTGEESASFLPTTGKCLSNLFT